MNRILKKISFTTVIALEVFLLSAQPILAVSIPSVSSVASQLEARYHLNLGSMQSYGEGFNVSEQKQPAPEVMLFFNPSNPKPGEELTATANPLYFSTEKEDLYYTWYLKHSECGLDDTPSDETKRLCDADGDGDITVNDWKVEAARIIASNYYEKKEDDYKDSDPDGNRDGYKAEFGGDRRDYTKAEYCYIHDFVSGINYELANGGNITYTGCANGSVPVCVRDEQHVCSALMDGSSTSGTGSVCGESFREFLVCESTGLTASCSTSSGSSTGTVSCASGVPSCTTPMDFICPAPDQVCGDGTVDTSKSCGSAASGLTCTISSATSAKSECEHLFANPPGGGLETGDDSFRNDEEKFWKTDPNDTDTADTGLSDEANVAGVGRDIFKWNYVEGDKVGVAVEGFSMVGTKHDDATVMIMWALPKNDCPVSNTSSYTKKIKGYDVTIPTASMDLNKCLERNLVDPREGGQATNLDLSLHFSPEYPINDPSDAKMGDRLNVSSSIKNGSETEDRIEYDWNIFISGDGSYNPRDYNQVEGHDATAEWVNITDALTEAKLVGQTKGNDLQSIAIDLNITDGILKNTETFKNKSKPTETTFPGGIGYLRVKTTAKQNFQDGITRNGKSQVIIKVLLDDNRIVAHIAKPVEVDNEIYMDIADDSTPICEKDPKNPIRSVLCYVTENEVLGLTIDDEDLKDFSWKINDKPYTCNKSMAKTKCENDKQTNYLFFPVTGDPGSRFDVKVSAMEVSSGKQIEMVRTFEIADPYLRIVPLAENSSVWKKYIGYYTDENGNEFPHYSEDVLQAFASDDIWLKAEFHPSFVNRYSLVRWEVNGNPVPMFSDDDAAGNNPIYATAGSKEGNTSTLFIKKGLIAPGSAYAVRVSALYKQSALLRKALKNIWGVSIFDSAQEEFSFQARVELVDGGETSGEGGDEVTMVGPKAVFAALITNAPKNILFFLQTTLTMLLVFFVISFTFSYHSIARQSRRDK